MIKITDKSFCSGCSACSSACPENCITMQRDEEGFKYPVIEDKLCVNCGLCENVCPIINNKTVCDEIKIAYAAVNTNDEIRLGSSSGGVFYAIAMAVIKNGGVIFGAKFDDEFSVIHDFTDSIEGLSNFQGSKYVQSDIGEMYIKAKVFLDEGKQVLFSGTPCQIGGLKSFLKTDYENLICQDIICHGVPSPMVWDKYLKFREQKASSKAKNIFFRNKDFGWKRFSIKFEFEKNSKYTQFLDKDPYMISFLKNASLRPSCFNCAFKTEDRQADITLADLWGVENIIPEMNDNKGTSLVIVHSKKGKNLFKELSDQIKYFEVDFKNAISYNSPMIKSVPKNNIRDAFLKEIMEKPFDKIVKKYLGESFFSKTKKVVKRCIIKFKKILVQKSR